MDQKGDLKDYEGQATSLNPGDNWRQATRDGREDKPTTTAKSDDEYQEPDKTNPEPTKNQDTIREKEGSQPPPIKFTGGNNKKGNLSGGKGPLLAVFGGLSASVISIALIGNMFSSILINMK
ncbi:hypothetical protein KC953_00675, partial [Candidatus Saccharibacteria bacterium]|nr:hypothetical protein [Candidatus Saccharibacteria bacterium]